MKITNKRSLELSLAEVKDIIKKYMAATEKVLVDRIEFYFDFEESDRGGYSSPKLHSATVATIETSTDKVK